MFDDLADLRAFHRAVDLRTEWLRQQHASRMQCRRGCSGCCFDGLVVWEVEAELIRQECGELLQSGLPHAPGACAFLGTEGECRIHTVRPHVCRMYGLPLRWVETDVAGRAGERRDICVLNAIGPPIEALPAAACWTREPANAELAELQRRRGEMREVALRSLFAHPPREPGRIGGCP